MSVRHCGREDLELELGGEVYVVRVDTFYRHIKQAYTFGSGRIVWDKRVLEALDKKVAAYYNDRDAASVELSSFAL